jgi:predicted nucleic-acid-binding Zn-ribbon protein
MMIEVKTDRSPQCPKCGYGVWEGPKYRVLDYFYSVPECLIWTCKRCGYHELTETRDSALRSDAELKTETESANKWSGRCDVRDARITELEAHRDDAVAVARAALRSDIP